MLKQICQIQTDLLTCVKELEGVELSLRDEYMFMAGYMDLKSKELKAKERQIDCVVFLQKTYLQIFDSITAMENDKFKLEACAVYHGLSHEEIRDFCKMSYVSVYSQVKYSLDNGIVQVPKKLRPYINANPQQELEFKH